jgi:hypothetical protein
VEAIGFEGLLARVELQGKQFQSQKKELNDLGEKLDQILFNQMINHALLECRSRNIQLLQTLLRILGKMENLRSFRSPMYLEQGGYRANLDQIAKEVDKVLSSLLQIKHKIEIQDEYGAEGGAVGYDPSLLPEIEEFLKHQQLNIMHLVEVLKADYEEVEKAIK